MGLFDGKTVIVTGGGKATLKDGSAGSIGYGIDIAFAKEGANLVITGRNVKKLEAAKESLEAEFDIKVLPKTMTDGYGSWWRVGDTEVSERPENLAAYQDHLDHVRDARKY